MDSLIAAAARALAAGDALGALKRVALRDDPPALGLRGIAMAQLGEYPRARELLRRAARAFGSHEELARARCVVAEAEVALAMRDFAGSPRSLASASDTLAAHGDPANALQALLIALRQRWLSWPPPSWHCARCASVRRETLSPARTRLRAVHVCRRFWPRWRRCAPRSIAPPRGAFPPAASRRCASTKLQHFWLPVNSSSTRVVAVCGPVLHAGRCCSRWCARSPRRGPTTSIGKH